MKKRKWIFLLLTAVLLSGTAFFTWMPLQGQPSVSADIKSENAVISWSSVKQADYYEIYRKKGNNGKYRCIGETEKLSFEDIYADTSEKPDELKLLRLKQFVDPSENPYVYTVKAVKKYGFLKKRSSYDEEGVFHIENPAIVSAEPSGDKVKLTWAETQNTDSYIVYTGKTENGRIRWEKAGEKKAGDGLLQEMEIKRKPGVNRYAVKGVYYRKGKPFYSGYDKGFQVSEKRYTSTRVLFIGDSITFGSPYKDAADRNIFSYPSRVQQLTGINLYNPSIPGASYGYRDKKDRDRLVTAVAEPLSEGLVPAASDPRIKFQGEPGALEDFDVIVLGAGANDYFDNIPPGKKDSSNIEEFNGALNRIETLILEGNKKRTAEGKAPVKIIFMKLFYNEENGDYSSLTFRVPEKNGLKLKMSDYQKVLDFHAGKLEKEGFDIYSFETGDFVTTENFPYVTSDGLHMTRYTYGQIGNRFSRFLEEQVL